VSQHKAWISWRSDGGFADNAYSRRHLLRFDGGAELVGSSSPDVVPVPRSDPAGVDPEEALVASAASCHMLWFLDLARQAGHVVESYEDEAVADMGRVGPGKIAIVKITLRPRIAFAGAAPDRAELDRMHHEAHERCFIANTLNCPIIVEG
jgi:organic hydroperoxide reductase OsmC/OhrA